MSYGVPPVATPAPRPRPSTVTTAGMLLYGLAGLTFISLIISAATFSKLTNAATDAYAGVPNGDTIASAAKIGGIVGFVLDVIVIVLLVLLALFNMRGSNGMRITTWVIAGLGVLCYGCGAIGGGLSGSFSSRSSSGDATQQQLNDAADKLRDALPGWLTPVQITASVLSLILAATVIILLALPASNQFFRKQEPEFVPYPQYPQYPQMPPVQGTPPTAPEGTPPAP